MLQGVVVLNESGETVISLGKNGMGCNTEMVGDLVGAVQMFIQQMTGDTVKSIAFGEITLYLCQTENGHVITMYDLDDDSGKVQSQRIAELVTDNRTMEDTFRFINQISQMLDEGNDT